MSNTKRSAVHFNVLAGSTPARLCKGALAALALACSLTGVAHAQAYANVTVGGAFAPGVYGQIYLGNNLPPPVLNVQPIIMGPPVYGAPVMYLHVPQNEYREPERNRGEHRGHYKDEHRGQDEHRGHRRDDDRDPRFESYRGQR